MEDLAKSTAAAALGLGYSAAKCPEWMTKFVDDTADVFRAFRQTGGVRADFMPLIFTMAKMNERIKELEAKLAPKEAEAPAAAPKILDRTTIDANKKKLSDDSKKLTAAGV